MTRYVRTPALSNLKHLEKRKFDLGMEEIVGRPLSTYKDAN